VLSHSVHLPILPDRVDALRGLLDERKLFERVTPGVHFARAALIGGRELTLGLIYDRRIETALNFVVENGDAFDAVLGCCDGYRPGDAHDPAALLRYFSDERYFVHDDLFFTAYDHAETEVQACLAVREHFLALLEAADSADASRLPYLVDAFLLASVEAHRLDDAARPKCRSGYLPFPPHLTNTLTMVQPLMQGRLDPSKIVPCSQERLEQLERRLGKHFTYRDVFEFILREGEFAVRDLREHPLAALHTLHFARIGVVDTPTGPAMLFSSVYDGDFTQYVLDFGSRVADQIDFIWGLTERYPRAGCRDVQAFVQWLQGGQVDVEAFFSAHGNVTLLQIQKSAQLRRKLAAFSERLPYEAGALRARLRAFVAENQALLS
jgi:hypothetical protein